MMIENGCPQKLQFQQVFGSYLSSSQGIYSLSGSTIYHTNYFTMSLLPISVQVLPILISIFILCIIYYGYRTYWFIQISRVIVSHTQSYSLTGSHQWISLLILGDSTAVGVGADHSADSIAGRLAKYVGVTRVENHGVSWAIVRDIVAQLAKVEKQEYDYILLQIWGNDMVRFHDLSEISREFEQILNHLPKSKTLIVQSCGNLGGASIFPRIMSAIYENISRSYHAQLWALVAKHWGIYIDLFEERSIDPFVLQPDIYIAADHFHPSSIWYGHWFDKLTIQIEINK